MSAERLRAFAPAGDPWLVPVLSLARAYEYDKAHTHHVTVLTLALFDQLYALHRLRVQHRRWLIGAALLHDIARVPGQRAHQRAAARIIAKSPALPWSRRVRYIVGAVARYHRGPLPRRDHVVFGSLSEADRRAVVLLAAMLRLADGLDFTHTGAVRGIRCRVTPERIEIICRTCADAAADIARGVKKSDLARKAFGREIRVEPDRTSRRS